MLPVVNLRGRHIIVTRPAAQAEGLCRAISHAGGIPLQLPLLRIAQVECAQALNDALASACDWAIFTSTNAVEQALAQARTQGQWPKHIAAVGAATASALEAAGLTPRFAPSDPYTSESLLQQLAAYPLRNRRVLLISGEGGRATLGDGLRAAGAEVRRLAVYQRIPVELTPALLKASLLLADSLLITSGEGLSQLLRQCPAKFQNRLKQLKLVVPGQRVLKMARDSGFGGAVAIARPMSETGIMQALGRVQNRE